MHEFYIRNPKKRTLTFKHKIRKIKGNKWINHTFVVDETQNIGRNNKIQLKIKVRDQMGVFLFSRRKW